ncbi:MvdC/MvdD family ATP grasp protein [Anaeromyxobacter oryzae]|uniref:ATP-grasp ribosomal peptide maturase n=1 Tax=Anaeromyxobacter oryzae TaxID=2918170 RepID=A0ABM7WNT5_9BACT|nr:alpha-L-glutamate ligase [Anaeromyxobacter oryzae]BDG01132.1 ATP-grasp ribosomal peptide maturase [Anaeromyxobacter oryzae]
MILAITHAGDEHAPLVLDALARQGAAATVLDLADLPVRGRVVAGYGPDARPLELRLGATTLVRADEVTAVWWRRPRPFTPAPGLGLAHADFAVRQTGEAVMGFLASLRATFVNAPTADEAAGHKPYQLALASAAGLAVPRTLVTSDPDEARAFLASLGDGGAIHKPLLATEAHARPTRRVFPADLARLDAVRLAPVLFQERIPGVDVRVTAVGEELFAAEIDARETASPDDFRDAYACCRVNACALPPAIASGLRSLMRDLGLLYGAIDLRRRDDGAWFFLEVNPGGQWFFVEQRTGQPITAALAALLAGDA